MSGLRLKDIPPFIRHIYPGDEYMAQLMYKLAQRAKTAAAIIFKTFLELEHEVFDTLSSKFPPCYAIGPLHLLEKTIEYNSLASIKSKLWKEESECLKWLDSQATSSVVYVNFGSITWGVAMEIDNDVKSDDVWKLVIELINGEKGRTLSSGRRRPMRHASLLEVHQWRI
ncbi:hypothetical protein Tco_1149471 [Tanacetum coccineum]